MSDENQETPAVETPHIVIKSIPELVKETLEGSTETVKNKVVDKLVSDQIEKRVSSVLKGLEDANKLRESIKKIKPDTQIFGVDGSVTHEGYSKAKLDERDKAVKDLAKLEEALNLVINDNKYEKLNQLVKV